MYRGILVFKNDESLKYFKQELDGKGLLTIMDLHTPETVDLEEKKPTLIVGFMLAKELLGEQFNPLEEVVDSYRSWCYSFEEKKQMAWHQISQFVSSIGEKLFSHIPYQYIGPENIMNDTFISFLDRLPETGQFKTYLNATSRTVYFTNGKVVYVISMNICSFSGLNVDLLLNLIKEKSVSFVEDRYNELLGSTKDLYFGYIHMERYIVLLTNNSKLSL